MPISVAEWRVRIGTYAPRMRLVQRPKSDFVDVAFTANLLFNLFCSKSHGSEKEAGCKSSSGCRTDQVANGSIKRCTFKTRTKKPPRRDAGTQHRDTHTGHHQNLDPQKESCACSIKLLHQSRLISAVSNLSFLSPFWQYVLLNLLHRKTT